MPQIRIESMLGGMARSPHAPQGIGQYSAAVGINPALPLDSSADPSTFGASQAYGMLKPTASHAIHTTNARYTPMWMVSTAKDGYVYVYDSTGSIYTVYGSFMPGNADPLGDLNDEMTSHGNGCAYYDNYVYFAADTTIARYGPLDGTPTFNDNYWCGTLAMAALGTVAAYHYPRLSTYAPYPNHVMHRHSDGRLYIADIVDGQGTIHYIKTTKTTVEGDTNDGSTYGALQVGYNLWPTCMESYGTNLVIAFQDSGGAYEGISNSGISAKIAIWDTTSDRVNSITWNEFTDGVITAMKNINGTLYIFSSPSRRLGGFRISVYMGGSTFQEIYRADWGYSPPQGAVSQYDGVLAFGNQLDSGGVCYPGVFTWGLPLGLASGGIFNIASTPQFWDNYYSGEVDANHSFADDDGLAYVGSINTDVNDTEVGYSVFNGIGSKQIIWGIGEYSGYYRSGICWCDTSDAYYTYASNSDLATNQSQSVYISPFFNIAQPFKITKITFPLGYPIGTNSDNESNNDFGWNASNLQPIYLYLNYDSAYLYSSFTVDPSTTSGFQTTLPGNRRTVVWRPSEDYSIYNPNNSGYEGFRLEIWWGGENGSGYAIPVGFPITIDYELIDMEQDEPALP